MVRTAIIEGGVVVNVIVSADGSEGVPSDTAAIGDAWDGEAFTAPDPPPTPIPQSVTRRQAKQALLLAGVLAGVQPAIDAIADATQRGLIQIEWDDSLNFERDRPTLIALATALGLDSAGIDALFIAAAQL